MRVKRSGNDGKTGDRSKFFADSNSQALGETLSNESCFESNAFVRSYLFVNRAVWQYGRCGLDVGM